MYYGLKNRGKIREGHQILAVHKKNVLTIWAPTFVENFIKIEQKEQKSCSWGHLWDTL